MSGGRKIFRFLKFMEDLKLLYAYLYKRPHSINVLKALICLTGFFYHLMDNLVWAVNIGVLNEYLIGEIRWKVSKNFFSLIRTVIKLFLDCLKLKRYIYDDICNEQEIQSEFNQQLFNFKKVCQYNIIKQTLENRAKLRLKALDIVHSTMRICMRTFSLKIEPFYSYSHPIIISICGVVQASISMFKQLTKESDYKSISIEGFSKKGSSLEKLLIEERNEREIFEENYFDNYYVDFNKDVIFYSEKYYYRKINRSIY
jgi:hypothetical protein